MTIPETMGDHHQDGGLPFSGWWLTVLGSVVTILVWVTTLQLWGYWETIMGRGWVTILRMLVDHLGDGGRPSWGWWVTTLGMVDGYPE